MSKNYTMVDISNLNDAVGKEFYLAVGSYDSKIHTCEEIEKWIASNPIRKFKRELKELFAKLRGREVRKFESYDGAMIEITSRQHHQIHGYGWPDVNSITYQDGTIVGKSIPLKEVFRQYIFVPDEVLITEKNDCSLIGTAREYNPHKNISGEPLEQKINVYYKQIPTKKGSDVFVGCF